MLFIRCTKVAMNTTTINLPWMIKSITTNNPIVKALADRLDWAKAQGDKPLWPNGPNAETYVQGFIRKSGMGSFVLLPNGFEMEEMHHVAALFDAVEWTEVPTDNPAPGCRYFQGSVPRSYTALHSVLLLGELADENLPAVKVRKGPHGLELFLGGTPQQTFTVTAIVDGDGLRTWYPGPITPAIDLAKATVKLG
jgi:hypothetical protein